MAWSLPLAKQPAFAHGVCRYTANDAVGAQANVISDDFEPLAGDSNDAVGISWRQRKALALPVVNLVANSATLIWPAADAGMATRRGNKIATLSTRTSTRSDRPGPVRSGWLVF